jgi:hypothetical protein
MADSRLQIRRVHAEYLVPADHPAPGHVKDRLDDEIKRSLSQVLSAAFSSWFLETDSSLWFVRRLEIDLAINAAGGGEGVSRTFTRQLGRALSDTLQDTDHNNVVRFSSPADYLARFLADLAAGDAWGRWYYESFFGLRMLPTSAVLRTVVCGRPDTGKEALLLLPKNELRDVLRALNRQDARLILESLTAGVRDESEFDPNEMAWSILRLIDPDLLAELNEWGRALYLYLSVARWQEEAGLDTTDAGLTLLRCSPDRLRDIAEELKTVQAEVRVAETERRYTSFGGAFLLLPLLDEIPLTEALHDWPHADEAAAISLVRFLLLIKCAGPKHAQHTLTNSLLRDLMLVPPTVSAEVLTEWQAHVTTTHIDNLLTTLIDWQRGQGRINDRNYFSACTSLNDSPVVVLIDEARSLWLKVSNLADVEQRLPPDKSINETVARHGELAHDLSRLALPESLKFSPALDLALSVAAQHLLRTFAWRLPGFAESNLPYLSNNFLDFPASLREEPTRRVVRLGSPSLRLVLGITGMMRQTYRLSWLDERPLTLFEES